jgi:hypothetical protein
MCVNLEINNVNFAIIGLPLPGMKKNPGPGAGTLLYIKNKNN